jgi:hypothetical protein
VSVACYAGATYPERPRALLWESSWLRVVEVEGRWRTPIGPAFRVKVADGRRFVLTYRETADVWVTEQIGSR